jgi:rare lipoprotein A (peptidoglycan hydrolase)
MSNPANKLLSACAIALACAAIGCCAAAAKASAPTGGTSAGQGIHARTARPQIATWFGPGFYGQKTACGQRMTPRVIGVASRTLPCGTLVLVRYGPHALTVPVIDRGPYAKNGAIWDLTAGAASALAITDTVRIKTKVVGRAVNTPNLGAPIQEPSAQAAGGGGTAAP